MVEPRVVPREAHTLSRNDVDPDALKVLYRLRQGDYVAYLVGGSVRDLLLGRRPKDFDIGTSAHPYQVKKLFRNCWIIGRRFRLAHVKFGQKVIEVATFRKQVPASDEITPEPKTAAEIAAEEAAARVVTPDSIADLPGGAEVVVEAIAADPASPLIERDNTFGTPEEDAFRRDFTVNALFYDIASFSVIDYVGGLEDLQARVVRCIGDPDVRLREDPVRMMRAIALAARLDFTIDPPLRDAINRLSGEIANSSPPRILEEYYKVLRAGAAEQTFRDLAAMGLLAPIAPELADGANERLWTALARIDAYRAQFEETPETMTNAVLLGTLLEPLGLSPQQGRPERPEPVEGKRRRRRPFTGPKIGALPLARRDLERLRQILGLQRRLRDIHVSVKAQHALTHRSIFREALSWLEIHGNSPQLVEHWITVLDERGPDLPPGAHSEGGEDGPPPAGERRRRRRRRRRRPN
jgi:poly(A) polymerase